MDVETARSRLLAERERLQATLAAARSMGDTGSVDGTELSYAGQHPTDSASDAAERQTAMALASTVDVDQRRVEAALARLEKGSYGRCEVCGTPVEDERLEVTPTARTCIEHREQESKLPDLA
jgi:RNA polymerase-binding transcription factor DksA